MKKGILTLIFLIVTLSAAKSQLVINEFLASNATEHYENTYYNFPDWIEIYNSGSSSMNLSGYYLSDDESDLKKWNFASKNLGAGNYYLIYCDKEEGAIHANFGLSSDGDSIYLSDAAGNIVDKIEYGIQYTDVSYGRDPANNFNWYYCIVPTPGKINTITTATEQASIVGFSVPAGRQSGQVDVNLVGKNIKFTLDGKEPGSGSTDYNQAISISKTRTIKARSFDPNYLPGKTRASTYFINEHEFTLPVVSLTFDNAYFYDNTIGIYVSGTNGGPGFCGGNDNWNMDWERAAFFEYFDKDGVKQISQLIGTKVGGGCTRGRDQKSLALYARSKYGDNDFDYSFFTQKPHINTYKSVLLRNSGNDQDLTLLRDAFIQALFNNSIDIDYQSYQPAAVYFNGEYRGIMNLREKVDEDYFESNYNIQSDEVDFLERDSEVIRGTDSAYSALLEYLSSKELSDDENFEFVASQIDIEECINYYAIEIYLGNRDWPENNIKFWRLQDDGKWRWVIFDTDYGLGFRMDAPNHPTFSEMFSDNDGKPWSTILFQQLMENDAFKTRFLNRITSLMHTNFQPEWCNNVLDSLAEVIDTEIAYNQKKFGRSKADWYSEIEKLRQQAAGRYVFMQDYLKSYFLLGEEATVSFSNSAIHQGKVRLNGIIIPDYPVNIETYKEFPLEIEAVAEKGYKFKQWNTSGQSLKINVIKQGEEWKYPNEAASYPTDWKTLNFDDAAWSSGMAQLGYGEGDENTEVSYGGDSNNKIPTYLFRKKFDIDEPDSMKSVMLGFLADDGGIVYLNGSEVFRFNMNEGTIDFNDYAAATVENENTFVYIELDKSDFIEGENIISCEVHQASGTSSDMSFDLSLEYTYEKVVESGVYSTSRTLSYEQSMDIALEPVFEEIETMNGIYLNELASKSGSFQDDYDEDVGYIELFNSNHDDIALYGYYLSDGEDNFLRYSIPDSTIIPADGFLLIYADGESMQGELHTNFKLDRAGEELFLSQKSGQGLAVLDSVRIGSLPVGFSYGKYTDGIGAWQYMYQSPDSANKPDVPVIVGIEKLSRLKIPDIHFKMYPNPSQGILSIAFEDLRIAEQKYFISITDITGRIVTPKMWINSTVSPIQIPEAHNGLYLVHLYHEGMRIKTEKLLIIK